MSETSFTLERHIHGLHKRPRRDPVARHFARRFAAHLELRHIGLLLDRDVHKPRNPPRHPLDLARDLAQMLADRVRTG